MIMSVPIASAIAGMRLARDICTDNDNVLLPHGSVLTPAIIAALQRRGIELIEVESSEVTDNLPTASADITQRIDHLFRRGGSNANMQLRAAIRSLRQVEAP